MEQAWAGKEADHNAAEWRSQRALWRALELGWLLRAVLD